MASTMAGISRWNFSTSARAVDRSGGCFHENLDALIHRRRWNSDDCRERGAVVTPGAAADRIGRQRRNEPDLVAARRGHPGICALHWKDLDPIARMPDRGPRELCGLVAECVAGVLVYAGLTRFSRKDRQDQCV